MRGGFCFNTCSCIDTVYVHFYTMKTETFDSFSFAESRARPCTWLCRARIRPVSPSTWERCSKKHHWCNDVHQYSYLLYSHYRVMQSIQCYKSNKTVTVCYTYFSAIVVPWYCEKCSEINCMKIALSHSQQSALGYVDDTCRVHDQLYWSVVYILYHTVPYWKGRKKDSMQCQTMPNRASCLDILIRCDGKCSTSVPPQNYGVQSTSQLLQNLISTFRTI